MEEHEFLALKRAKIVIEERGHVEREITGTRVIKPDHGKKWTSYERCKNRERLRRTSAIEATISHLKQQFHMGRNYLKGIRDDQSNDMLAAVAWNFRKCIREMAHSFLFFFQNNIQNPFFNFFSQFYIKPKKKNGVVKDELLYLFLIPMPNLG